MKNIKVTLNKENIEKYLESGTNITNVIDSETDKEINYVYTKYTCYNFVTKALLILKAYAHDQKFYKLYEWTNKSHETFLHLKLVKNKHTNFLFNTFDKLGIPLSMLTLECNSDFTKLNVSNLILKHLKRLSDVQRTQLTIYLLSVMKLFVSFKHFAVVYDSVLDVLYTTEERLKDFVAKSIFSFTDIVEFDNSITYEISQINTDDYIEYKPILSKSTLEDPIMFVPEYHKITYKCVKYDVENNSYYGIALKLNSIFYFVCAHEDHLIMYQENSMCYLTYEGEALHTFLQKYAIKAPTFRHVSLFDNLKLSNIEFIDLEDLENLEEASDVYSLINHLQKEFPNCIENIPTNIEKIFKITIKVPETSKYDLSSEYKDDAFAQELYKQIQPYYENFNLKSLEYCLKGFASPNGIYSMLFTGDTGTGKSTAAKVIPTRCGMPFISVNFSTNLEESDIIGTMIPNPAKSSADDPEFIWQDGILTKAVRNGYVFNAEEINFARPGVLSKLNSLLDEYRQIDLPTGEIVKAHKNFRLIATCNIAYEGTNRFNKALINRFDIVHAFNELDKTELFNVITQRTGYKDTVKMENIYNVYEALKKYAKEQNLDVKISVRQMLNIFTKGVYYRNALEAVKDIMLNGAFIEDEEYKQFFEENILAAFALKFKL